MKNFSAFEADERIKVSFSCKVDDDDDEEVELLLSLMMVCSFKNASTCREDFSQSLRRSRM